VIIVLGCGIVGRAAIWDLVRRGHDVVAADADPAAALGAANEFGAESRVIDVSDEAAVVAVFADAAAVVAAVPYRYGEPLARAAIAAGTHYFDFGGNPTVVAAQLRLDAAARGAGVAVIPDGGLAPGIANVLAEDLIERLGDGPVHRVAIRVGALPQEPTGALGYALAFSPGGLVNEYAEPCEILHRRRRTTVEPLTGLEEVDWPGRGPLEAFHTAGGISTMCARWESRVHHLDYKTLRYPGHCRSFRAMYELGLFDEEPWPVGGRQVAPRPVLLHALATRLPRDVPDVVLVRVAASTVRNGVEYHLGTELEDLPDGRFSALARTTAFPVTAAAHLIATGALTLSGAVAFHAAITAAEILPELEPLGIVPRAVDA
jgi:lysine 6-dehydrogenase